jgi:glyceraldehyde 3-phosphate dehydrogenase
MIEIGINGFGRIGKCIILQLINNNNFKIKCINAINIKITDIEEYLKYDSTHHYDKSFYFEIISDTEFMLEHHKIKLLSDRTAKNLNWRSYGCKYLIDATGSYLIKEQALEHDVDFVIMTAPAKDNTPTFIYGVNENTYSGENIISGSSCTTNCLAPMLVLLDDNFKIKNCVFTTIHSTTASQNTVDVVDKKLRTSRTILNNIIPHTTGASKSIINVLPQLKNKINGTSIRVPVLNCSLLDVNIELEENITLEDLKNKIITNKLYKLVYDINERNLVSCDFLTTITPCILDMKASIDMNNGKLKLILWYDNEWSYCAQLIRLLTFIYKKK